MHKRPLLLAPAGSFSSLTAALAAGADAVYFGSTLFNMRATAGNFQLNQLPEVVRRTRDAGAKAFLTLNVQVYDDELGRAERVLSAAREAGVDAVIAWDPAVMERARALGLPLHVSTQASVANVETALHYERLGARTVVLARELSLDRIAGLIAELRRRGSDLAVEIFAHGAMCVAVSGRCFLSQHAFGKSGNRGECTQPCRRSWRIVDDERELEFRVEASTLLSPRDLCTLPIMERILASGVGLLKIEGRSRSPEYVSTVTGIYRRALDGAVAGTYDAAALAADMEALSTVYNKKFHTGFYERPPGPAEFTDVENSAATHRKVYLGRVTRVYGKIGVFDLEMHSGELVEGTEVLIIGPRTGVARGRAVSIQDADGRPVPSAHRGDLAGVKLDPFTPVRPKDKVFVLEPVTAALAARRRAAQ